MKSARVLPWSLCVAIAIVVQMVGCDSAPGSVARLKQVFAARPPVADPDNAFLDAFGFGAPAGADAHELGARRVAWIEKFQVDPKSAGDDPGKPALEIKAHRSQALTRVMEACRAAIARACSSALERASDETQLSDLEPLLLARYEVLLGRSGWFETGTIYPSAPLPSYEGTLEAQRLLLIRLRSTAAAGDAQKVRATLGRDLAYWRMALASSDVLISKMIALAAIRQHFALGSFVLRDLPVERQTEAVPPQWRAPFTAAERSLLRVMAGELMFAEQVLLADQKSKRIRGGQSDDGDDGEDDEGVQSPVDRLVNGLSRREFRQPTLGEIADNYLSAAEGFAAPLSEYQAVSAKLHGSYVRSQAGWDIGEYAVRVGSAEGMRRAALLTVELRSQSVPVAELTQHLKDSALRNPYNGQPFEWDAADQAIVFNGPETNKYRRQAYPY